MDCAIGYRTHIKTYDGDYAGSTESMLAKFPDFLNRIKGRSVLIKPNIWKPHPRGSGSVTDSYLVREIARCLLDGGAAHVAVGEGTAVGYAFLHKHSAEQAFEVSGLTTAMKDLGLPILDLNSGPFEEIKREDFLVFSSIQIARAVMDYEILLNVPVMKSHFRTKVSLGMKNLKGILSPRDKRNCHKLGLDEGIVDLNRAVCPDFVFMDGIHGLEGLWELPNDTVEAGLLVASEHPLHADMVGASLMGADCEKVRHISLAKNNNLYPEKEISLEQLPSELVRPFKDPGEVLEERFPHTIMCISEACTGCYGAITAPMMNLYNNKKAFMLDDYVIFSGPGVKENDVQKYLMQNKKIMLIGQCADKYKQEGCSSVGGCPPSQDEVMKALSL